MLCQNIFLVAMMGLAGFSHGAGLMDADVVFRRDIEQLPAPLISDSEVLDALKALGFAPEDVFTDEYGDVIQNNYIFHEEEWEKMRDHLYQQAGFNTTDLAARTSFVCTRYAAHPKTYTAVLSPLAGIICGTFHYVTVDKGKNYVAERFTNAQGQPLKDRIGNKVKVVLTYAWLITSAASSGQCAGFIAYGIDHYCTSQVNGQTDTLGMSEYQPGVNRASVTVDAV